MNFVLLETSMDRSIWEHTDNNDDDDIDFG